jgi:hypothetical protein
LSHPLCSPVAAAQGSRRVQNLRLVAIRGVRACESSKGNLDKPNCALSRARQTCPQTLRPTPTPCGTGFVFERVAVRAEHDDWDFRHHPFQNPCRLQAVHHWHRQVEQNQVWVQFPSSFNCLPSVFRISANFEVLFHLEEVRQTLPNQWIIIRYEDSVSHTASGPLAGCWPRRNIRSDGRHEEGLSQPYSFSCGRKSGKNCTVGYIL